MLALQAEVSASEAADALVAMAGATPAGPIAAQRALRRLRADDSHLPSHVTAAAVQTLVLAAARLPVPRFGP